MGSLEFWGYVLIYGAILTYICWGFVFAIQGLLLLYGRSEAIEWLRKRYSFKVFMIELAIFFPMLLLFYFLLEIVPAILRIENAVICFSISDVIERAEEALNG